MVAPGPQIGCERRLDPWGIRAGGGGGGAGCRRDRGMAGRALSTCLASIMSLANCTLACEREDGLREPLFSMGISGSSLSIRGVKNSFRAATLGPAWGIPLVVSEVVLETCDNSSGGVICFTSGAFWRLRAETARPSREGFVHEKHGRKARPNVPGNPAGAFDLGGR